MHTTGRVRCEPLSEKSQGIYPLMQFEASGEPRLT